MPEDEKQETKQQGNKLITEVNDNVDGKGASVHQIKETNLDDESIKPLPTEDDDEE